MEIIKFKYLIRTFKINLMLWKVYKQLCCWTNLWYLGALGRVYRNTCAVVTKPTPQNNHTSFLLQKTFHSLLQSCAVKGSNMRGLFPLWSSATSCRTCIMHCKSKLRRRNWQWDRADCRLSMGWHCPPLERAEFDWGGAEVSEICTPTGVSGQTAGLTRPQGYQNCRTITSLSLSFSNMAYQCAVVYSIVGTGKGAGLHFIGMWS